MTDTNPNRIKWNLRRYGKLLRFLKNELKTRPAVIKPIVDKISVKDDKLFFGEKQIVLREEAMNIIRQYDLNPMYSGGINKLEELRQHKIGGISIIDTAGTIAIGYAVSKVLKTDTFMTIVLTFVAGEFVHLVYDIETPVTRFIKNKHKDNVIEYM